MRITVASGKGGTGKTTFAVNLAYALGIRGDHVRLLDCDVEEPNDHLFVRPEFTSEQVVTVPKPVWDEERCTGCGECAKACNYNAIAVVKGNVLIFNELCHSCGVCSHVCPEEALRERDTPAGKVLIAGNNRPFFFAHGLLNIGEALAPNVVRAVKEHIDPRSINILDAAPGTACPVVEALEGADAAVLLTEPTPFGLNDLRLAVSMALQIGVPTGIVINRSAGADELITDYADLVGVPVIGTIPFQRKYAEGYSRGEILADHHPELRDILLGVYDRILALRDSEVPPVPSLSEMAVDPGPDDEPVVGNAESYGEMTVISGKGGTGKTTVVASFAALSSSNVLADNDVDAADLHLLIRPRVREAHPFVGGQKAVIDPSKCTACGACAEACHFDAIRFDGPGNDELVKTYRVEPLACEGCGLCPLVCPEDAIGTQRSVTGTWYVSTTECGPMVHARLGIAEENSGRLVTRVRGKAASLAEGLRMRGILGDGPPGTGCPVIASVSGSDLLAIVTEPTVSGVHDMERVLDLAEHFGVPAVVIINKADLNEEQADRIERMALAKQSRVVGRIPFDKTVNDALMLGKRIVDYDADSPAAKAVREAWRAVQSFLG
ncbi:P-loop NTPase [Candidatus Fermentibacteria bacterium]|nr:P-loop NTPase [Candidatus Fermentibacteria bacterium]